MAADTAAADTAVAILEPPASQRHSLRHALSTARDSSQQDEGRQQQTAPLSIHLTLLTSHAPYIPTLRPLSVVPVSLFALRPSPPPPHSPLISHRAHTNTDLDTPHQLASSFHSHTRR